MSRSSFLTRTPSSRDQSPLLPQHRNSLSLQTLSPRGSSSRSPAASPSPPPSFYRSNNNNPPTEKNSQRAYSPSPSPSRTKSRSQNRRILFSAPPPPIATSVVLPSSYSRNARPFSSNSSSQTHPVDASRGNTQLHVNRAGTDPLLVLERREKAIQSELQLFLDAQSTGLVQGFGGSAGGEGSEGSSTPTTAMSVRSGGHSNGKGREGGVIPVRQPKRKVIGLRGARRGVGRGIQELVNVKGEEGVLLEGDIERRKAVLERVKVWEERIEGVRKRLEGATRSQGREEDNEIDELRTEEKAVENEIREMEDRLAQMRARKKWLGERIREGENRKEARLSSYRGALREVESEVREFLNRPPVDVSVVMGVEEGFMALPVNRRTLGMAREWWSKEIEFLQARKAEVDKEKEALEEGAKMWEDSVTIVTEFEDKLRKEMAIGVQDSEMMRKQIESMHHVVERLSENMRVAESKGWNLLICAIGAELEAFREGEGILKGALEVVGRQEGRVESEREESFHTTNEGLNGLEGLRDLSLEKGVERKESFEDSEDDGPPKELLVDEGGDVD